MDGPTLRMVFFPRLAIVTASCWPPQIVIRYPDLVHQLLDNLIRGYLAGNRGPICLRSKSTCISFPGAPIVARNPAAICRTITHAWWPSRLKVGSYFRGRWLSGGIVPFTKVRDLNA